MNDEHTHILGRSQKSRGFFFLFDLIDTLISSLSYIFFFFFFNNFVFSDISAILIIYSTGIYIKIRLNVTLPAVLR